MSAEGAVIVWLVRHGETEWNRARRVMGRRPIPLCDAGREQLGRLMPHLRGLGIAGPLWRLLHKSWMHSFNRVKFRRPNTSWGVPHPRRKVV